MSYLSDMYSVLALSLGASEGPTRRGVGPFPFQAERDQKGGSSLPAGEPHGFSASVFACGWVPPDELPTGLRDSDTATRFAAMSTDVRFTPSFSYSRVSIWPVTSIRSPRVTDSARFSAVLPNAVTFAQNSFSFCHSPLSSFFDLSATTRTRANATPPPL